MYRKDGQIIVFFEQVPGGASKWGDSHKGNLLASLLTSGCNLQLPICPYTLQIPSNLPERSPNPGPTDLHGVFKFVHIKQNIK